jgi:GTP-binding protein
MIDATRGLESQDVSIISLAHRYNKGILLMINKWDMVEKDSKTAKQIEDSIRKRLAPIDYMPILFTSVVNKQRIFQAMEKAVEVYQNKFRKIPTSQLNDVLLKEIENYPPPAIKGKFVKIKYITQFPAKCPTFAFYCNLPQYIQESYQRYLENKIREHFGLQGVPIRLFFRQK